MYQLNGEGHAPKCTFSLNGLCYPVDWIGILDVRDVDTETGADTPSIMYTLWVADVRLHVDLEGPWRKEQRKGGEVGKPLAESHLEL